MKLYIGNKNYSSWSMRPWVLMRQLGIDFEEVMIRFDGFEPDSAFKIATRALHPAATVPILEDEGLEDEGVVIADTLAITEYLAERHDGIWPQDHFDRAEARVLCATMHAGFSALRACCPMNIEADLPKVGARLLADHPALVAELDLLEDLLAPYLDGEGFLFGGYSAADAFYAPVMTPLKTYHLPMSSRLATYQSRVLAAEATKTWIADALEERDFLPFEEPYRDGSKSNK
ncbi:MAG: glutathione S-transferase [Alphaproteobacteria bacterium]|nr:glutathione S-transferase [Alphaproteobacteria bacterium]